MSALETRSSARADAPARDSAGDTGNAETTRHYVRMRYMPGLDGLRAFAVTGVLLYHADLSWIPGGFLGVDVFFVISGYLITSLLLAEFRNQGRIGLGQFYLRRARRLLPALFLLLGVVGLFAVVFLPDEVTKLRGDVVAALFYGTNWWQIFHNLSYFEAAGRPPLLQHLWSLAVEEQFYLVWPLLLTAMFKLWHGRRRPMILATLGLIAVSSLLMIGLSISRGYPLDHDPSRVYYGTDTRMFTMLIGAVLAMVWAPWRLSERTSRGGRVVLDAIGVGSLLGLTWMFLNVNEFSNDLYRGGFLVCSILAALVIAVTVHPAADLGRFILGNKPMRWIGERSYGIYLWHWPVFMVTRPVLDINLTGTPNLILRLAITVALAELSFRYVEQPVRQGALSRWFKALRASTGSDRISMAARTAVLGGSLLLGVVLVAVGLANGQPAPIPPGLDAKAAAAQTSVTTTPLPTTPATTAPGSAPTTPTAPPNPAIPRVTLIGDSVMVGAANALQQALGPVRIDAAVNRQFGTAIDILNAIKASGQLSDTVVVHMGTNGVITQGHMDAIMNILKDRKRVVFVNLKVPRRWEQIDNDVLAANVAKYPNAKLIDWHTIGNAHPEYFYQDGIHLNPTGQRAYAALIQQQTSPNP
ncbi:MAG TPA: acyltransferase family protein [Acidimicrobiia bacterium]|jgi:peptidoglycan/LPS O-acetylase OafA/YrhL